MVTDFFAEDKASGVKSNFAQWFIGILGRQSPISVNFAPPEAQNWPTNQPAVALNYKYNWKEPSLACRPKSTEVRAAGELASACTEL